MPVSDVLVADASRRTTTLNAYVSGFGSTRRVVLYDNLVDDVPERETLVVVAHELGHARHHDVVLGTALGATGVVFGSGLLGLVLSRRRLLDRAGVRDPGQPEVVALLLALVAVGTLLVSPIENTISRAIEARADRASLQATGDYAGFEKMQAQLATRSLSDPDPPWLSQFWFGSHPTALQRIGMARALEQQRRPRDDAGATDPATAQSPASHAGQQVALRVALAGDDAAGASRRRLLMTPPNRKTMATIRAAMPATSRPYSTAEAPFSSRRLVMLRMNSSMGGSPRW